MDRYRPPHPRPAPRILRNALDTDATVKVRHNRLSTDMTSPVHCPQLYPNVGSAALSRQHPRPGREAPGPRHLSAYDVRFVGTDA